RDRHRLPAQPDHEAGHRAGGGRRPDARQPGLHARPDLLLHRGLRADRGRDVPGGRLRAGADRRDAHLVVRRPVPGVAAQGGRRPRCHPGRGPAGRGLPAGAVRAPALRRVRAAGEAGVSGFTVKPEPVQVPGLTHLHTGKVRELYATASGELVMVATDRVSAYDWVLPTEIPDKGRLLTALSLWWFERLADLAPSHVLSDAPPPGAPADRKGRTPVCRRLDMVPVECVARGYLTGSGLAEYREGGAVCGVALPAGLEDGSRLDEPVFTPATKAEVGEHDENVSFEAVSAQVGAELAGE